MEGGKSGLFACQLDLRDRKCLGNAVILCQGPPVRSSCRTTAGTFPISPLVALQPVKSSKSLWDSRNANSKFIIACYQRKIRLNTTFPNDLTAISARRLWEAPARLAVGPVLGGRAAKRAVRNHPLRLAFKLQGFSTSAF